MGTVKKWDTYLLEKLKNPNEAAEFLNAALEENDPDFFKECFEKVMLAQKDTFQENQHDISCLTSIAPVLQTLKLRFAVA